MPAEPIPSSPTGTPTHPGPGTTQAVIQMPHVARDAHGLRLGLLSLTALGVVFGDIGTSPLYALSACFNGEYGISVGVFNVYGALSLIVWALIITVSIKYIGFIMRADNHGEGGILALLALLLQQKRRTTEMRGRAVLIGLGLFGAALLFGDGVITPAITVLSAVEGIEIATPAFQPFVVIVTVIILVLLFSLQRNGTARVGTLFGPVMLLWFTSIGVLGVIEIAKEPVILMAINPWYGLRFLFAHGVTGFFVLGAVVLAVTGAEALYADMGHFGPRPIRIGWFSVVFPALLLNYFGQGALLLRDPSAVHNPFYLLAPRALLYPMVAIATLAAIIASQALISGAFSLAQQTIQLGYSPRLTIVHTSARETGQIYVPEVNKALAVGCILIVLGFRSAAALGAAYGIAVTGTMVITTLLFYVVMRARWNYSALHAGLIAGFFLIVDLAFFAANVIKVEQGGWVPLAIAVGLFTLMTTWKTGRLLLSQILHRGTLPFDLFLEDVQRRKPVRVPGTAVFMTSGNEGAPVVLLHHLKHNKVLHDQVILMSINTLEVPEVPAAARVTYEMFPAGFVRVVARYGFMETPNVKNIMAKLRELGLRASPLETTFYLGRERLLPTGSSPMAKWRKKVFVFMSRNARSATEFFGIPPNRVVELGAQIEF